MKNNYGNYVVQKALKLAKGSLKSKLITTIVKNIDKIGDKKLMMKWKSIVNTHINFNNFSNNDSGSMSPVKLKSKPVSNYTSSKNTSENVSPQMKCNNNCNELNLSFNSLSLDKMLNESPVNIPKKKKSFLITSMKMNINN